MNSRVNFGSGNSIPPEREISGRGSWVPATNRPVPARSRQFRVDGSGNFVGNGVSGGFMAGSENYNLGVSDLDGNGGFQSRESEKNMGLDHIVGSFTQSLGSDFEDLTDMSFMDLLANGGDNEGNRNPSRNSIWSSFSQVGGETPVLNLNSHGGDGIVSSSYGSGTNFRMGAKGPVQVQRDSNSNSHVRIENSIPVTSFHGGSNNQIGMNSCLVNGNQFSSSYSHLGNGNSAQIMSFHDGNGNSSPIMNSHGVNKSPVRLQGSHSYDGNGNLIQMISSRGGSNMHINMNSHVGNENLLQSSFSHEPNSDFLQMMNSGRGSNAHMSINSHMGNGISMQTMNNHGVSNGNIRMNSRVGNGNSIPITNSQMRINSPVPNMNSHVGKESQSPGSCPQLYGNWRDCISANLLRAYENHCSSSNRWSEGCSVPQMHQNGHRPSYNLNSPPLAEIEPSTKHANSSPFAPVTPDQSKKLEKPSNLSTDSSSSQEKDRHETLVPSVGHDAIEQNSNQLLQNIVDSSSAAVSTPLKEKNDSDKEETGIDLNKTPQQKHPKRRKHRPKVIIEGKPKRTPKKPKMETPKSDIGKETPRVKRKYVRKKGLQGAETPASEIRSEAVDCSNVAGPAKSCKRMLNFDLEEKISDENPESNQQNCVNIENPQEPSHVRTDYPPFSQTHVGPVQPTSANNMEMRNPNLPPFSQTHVGPVQPNSANNMDTRNQNLENVLLGQDIVRNSYVQMMQRVNSEGIGQVVFRGNNTHANLERPQLLLQRAPPTVPNNLADSNQATGFRRGYCNISDQTGPDTYNMMSFQVGEKRRRIEDRPDMSISPAMFPVTPSRQVSPRGANDVNLNQIASQMDQAMLASYLSGNTNKPISIGQARPMAVAHSFPNQRVLADPQFQAERMMPSSKPNMTTRVHDFNSLTTVSKASPMPKTPPKVGPTYGSGRGNGTIHAVVVAKKQAMAQALVPFVSSASNKAVLQANQLALYNYQQPTPKPRGRPPKQKNTDTLSIDELTRRLKGLSLRNRSNRSVRQDQNALVPYKADGTLIAYDWVKKRKQRPKVDLDPETNRVWNCLMGPTGSDGVEGDKDKEKWWETEREVFRSRADSFVSRMRLVQGNRSFSPWKGSVVDSVIGVFLTQNVSDHLSSSAFMSLVARFPPPACSTHHQTIIVEEPEVCILDPPRQLFYNRNPTTTDEPFGYRKAEEEVISSQDAFECIVQTSVTNSEAEKATSRSHPNAINGSTSGSRMWRNIEDTRSTSGNNFRTTSQNLNTDVPSANYWPQMGFDSGVLEVESLAKLPPQEPPMYPQYTTQTGPCAEKKQVQVNDSFARETLDVEERIFVVDKQVRVEKKVVEPNPREQAGKESTGTNNNVSKTKKATVGDEKKETVDWDMLRRNVLAKYGKRERNKNTMDSVDYEAMRHANVKAIASTIKDRGMMNLLGDRIKDFLERTVRDHGSIDLEWLRDVPPDKAKDYLLSIWGIGLKSVECIRLLTLHHVAFPVDTNVGRIAVRLGWVPLQPLPETLQLHLLELYPILETIQKYLWPRLCKLDQRTLYELHYQLITFGKVFCTKSKPNCNACPMRGECRHFASAFASARLPLPGPGERSIVRSTIPVPPPPMQRIPEVTIHPMLLPSPHHHQYEETRQEISRCEPIVEVPATPEPQEITQSDIEDAFYEEDPDEIPTIDISAEAFKLNVQNYMQENMQLSESDMSRALVVLSQKADSVVNPPKLKNVSRLRTEHHVYELPDSHPLLNRMDRREPDDPCPYLLAIWAPGETATSFRQPGGCGSQESGILCNLATCFSCNNIRETNAQTVRGTILIPCRTAMRGSFPLNGTYFQVNEVFADHASSITPIDVPRAWIWNLERRIVYFGTSVTAIFKGLSTDQIQACFWRGFVCVRGFEQETRAPRPLMARLHFPASKLAKSKKDGEE